MRRAGTVLLVGGLSMLASIAAPAHYVEATNTRAASASIKSGGVSASVYAQARDAVSEETPKSPSISSATWVCASVSSAKKYDSGCGVVPVVIDSQLGTATASGTISPANCLSYCSTGVITVNVTWVATGSLVPATPGVPWFCIDPFLQCAEVRVGATVSRAATASGTVSSSIAGTTAGSDGAASISQTVRILASM